MNGEIPEFEKILEPKKPSLLKKLLIGIMFAAYSFNIQNNSIQPKKCNSAGSYTDFVLDFSNKRLMGEDNKTSNYESRDFLKRIDYSEPTEGNETVYLEKKFSEDCKPELYVIIKKNDIEQKSFFIEINKLEKYILGK